MGGDAATLLLLVAVVAVLTLLLAAALSLLVPRAPEARAESLRASDAHAEALKPSESERRAWTPCRKVAAQHLLYHRALDRARAEGRLLVVVGNPSGGWVNQVAQGYDCGDVCIDLKGCAPCPPTTRVFAGDALEGLRTVPADSAVVFESEVFEYPGRFPEILAEVSRITGGERGRVFAVHTIGLGDAFWEYHTRGTPPPPFTAADLDGRRANRHGYAKTGEGLAVRMFYRFPPRHDYAWADI